MGWYKDDDVAGFLVEDSYIEFEDGNDKYLGFLIKHSGTVQLGIPIEQETNYMNGLLPYLLLGSLYIITKAKNSRKKKDKSQYQSFKTKIGNTSDF